MTVAGIWILIAGCVVSLLITIITTKKRPEQFELYDILSLVTLFVFAFIAIFPWVLSGHTSSQDSRKFFIFLEAYMLLRILYFNEVSKKLPEISETLRKRVSSGIIAVFSFVVIYPIIDLFAFT